MPDASTRCQVIAALGQIVGLRLSATHRGADLRVFHFGERRAAERGFVADFALHVQCPWRIDGPAGIVTGRSDLWEPVERPAGFSYDAWHYDQSPNVQDQRIDQWLSQSPADLLVERVDADDWGGATVFLSDRFALRLFPAGTCGEDWRLFRPRTDAPHFVITAGRVEPDDL